jgi:hypothetical protein
MSITEERRISYWMQDAPAIKASPLQSDQTCNVVVIGSGIAGPCEHSRSAHCSFQPALRSPSSKWA